MGRTPIQGIRTTDGWLAGYLSDFAIAPSLDLQNLGTQTRGGHLSRQLSRDRYGKRLRIGVSFDGTNFVLPDGEPLPKLVKGSAAEIVVAPECIENEIVRASLSRQKSAHFLNEGAVVLVGVSPSMVDGHSHKGLIAAHAVPILSPYLFVEVKLNADLWLQVRGDQEARLSNTRCTIRSLNEEAKSLNHAFMLISEAYETKRRSHSGNVFERAYAQDERGDWQSLDDLRLLAIQRLAQEETSAKAGSNR